MRWFRKAATAALVPALVTSLVIPNGDDFGINRPPNPTAPGAPTHLADGLNHHPTEASLLISLPCADCDPEDSVTNNAELAYAFDIRIITHEREELDQLAYPPLPRNGVEVNGIELNVVPSDNLLLPSSHSYAEWQGSGELEGSGSLPIPSFNVFAKWHVNQICLDEHTDPCQNFGYLLSVLLFNDRDASTYETSFAVLYTHDAPVILKAQHIHTLGDLDLHNIPLASNFPFLGREQTDEPATEPDEYDSQASARSMSSSSFRAMPSATAVTFTHHPVAHQVITHPTPLPQLLDEVVEMAIDPTSILEEFQKIDVPLGFIKQGLTRINNLAQAVAGKIASIRPCQARLSDFSYLKHVDSDSDLAHAEFMPPSEVIALSPTATVRVEVSSATSGPVVRNDQAVRALKITTAIIVLVGLTAMACAFLMQNPRRRADRAAQREERRNIRLFHAAARRQKWHNWFRSLKGVPPSHRRCVANNPNPWGEKRFQPREQGIDGQTMQDELFAFRSAHHVVDGLLQAEEGNFRSILSKARFGRRERRPRGYSETGSEKTAPPAYEEENLIVDGMLYTFRGTNATPDSSVIDTSPRTSIYLGASDSEKE